MGNSPFLKEDNRIFLETEISIELSAMKHINNTNIFHLYIYGFYEETQRHYLLDLIIDTSKEDVTISYLLKDNQNLINILPSHSIYKSDFIYSTINNLVYVNNECDTEYLIKDEKKIYKKLFWPQLEETQLIGIDIDNTIELIDLENKFPYGGINNRNSINTSIFNKTIIDAYLLDKSPYRNCLCMSTNDSNMLLYDYRNKCLVDKIKTNKIVKNISFNELSQMKISCSELNSNVSYVYDFRRSDKPMVTFKSFNEWDNNKDRIIKKQSWIPNHSKCLMTLNSNTKDLLFYYIDFPMERLETNCTWKYENKELTNDKVIWDYYSTENYVMLQYEKEIEIISYKDSLKLF